MDQENVRTISLVVCTFTFLLAGAAIYEAFEGEVEAEQHRWLVERRYGITTRYNMTEQDLDDLVQIIRMLVPHNARQWRFAGSFFFCVTVMTTIGYGHSTPRTSAGKLLTVVYALIGVPLGLVMFQSIGDRLNTFTTFLLANIKKLFRFKDTTVSHNNLIIIDSFLVLAIIFLGAFVFDHYEDWGYWNAVYYCIISLTTVGFGDMVPLQGDTDHEKRTSDDDDLASGRVEYLVFTLLFITIGMTVVLANMNLVVLRFVTNIGNRKDKHDDEVVIDVDLTTLDEYASLIEKRFSTALMTETSTCYHRNNTSFEGADKLKRQESIRQAAVMKALAEVANEKIIAHPEEMSEFMLNAGRRSSVRVRAVTPKHPRASLKNI